MDLEFFNLIVSYLSEITELIPCIVYLKFTYNKPPYNFLGYYFILNASIKTGTVISAAMASTTCLHIILLAIIEVVFLYSFYAKIIYNSRPHGLVILVLILLSVVNSVFIENINHFNSIGWTFSVVFLLCLALRYLYKLYDDLENIQLGSHPLSLSIRVFNLFYGISFYLHFRWEILSKEARGFFIMHGSFKVFQTLVKI